MMNSMNLTLIFLKQMCIYINELSLFFMQSYDDEYSCNIQSSLDLLSNKISKRYLI